MAYIVALNVTRKGVIRRWVGCVVIFTGTKRERERSTKKLVRLCSYL